MSLFSPRPRFTIDLPVSSVEVILARLREALGSQSGEFEGALSSKHVVVRLGQQRRKLWSPVLDADVVQREEGVRIDGRFGPHPNVWTLFVFIRACLFVALISTSVYACSKSLVYGESSMWTYVALAAVLVIGEYVGVAVAQKNTQGDMDALAAFVRGAVGDGDIPAT